MMKQFLLSKDSKGKFRFAVVECTEEWNESLKGYTIQRSYGQVGGKTTLSPTIVVDRTKQKRNWKEQYTLQFSSEVKKFLDKGYKAVDKHPNDYTIEELNTIFGEVKTNQYGIIKPMLAKQESKITNRNILNKEWLVSKKLDGVRCLMAWDGQEVHAYSRGGDTYDYSTEHLRKDPNLVKFFTDHPTVILDGELYHHGKTLQQISGAARLEKNAYDCEWLQYWIYDCYDQVKPEMIFNDRLAFLTINLPFATINIEDSNPIHLVHHTQVFSEPSIWDKHDEFVQEGFEGCVIRDPDRPYKPNGRTNDMIKFKNYKSEDFKVIGYELGLRGSEDMCFICEMPNGKTFKAMPCGTREEKQEYVDNFEIKYKNKLGECTFFNYSDDGTPTQPKFRIFRWDL